MSNILNQYIKKFILLNISLMFLILVSLSTIMRLIDELRNFGKKNNFIFEIFFCTILNLPKEFDLFLPIATLLGGVLGLSILETRNELMIMQIVGLSKLQIALSVIKATVFVLLFNIISNEWLLPYSQKLICKYEDYKQYNVYLFPEKNKNLWLIDNNNNFICIEDISNTQELLGINFYYFNENRKLYKIVYVERAMHINQYWSLSKITELDFSKEACVVKNNIPYFRWDTELTPRLLSMLITHPRVLSISNLKCCIQYFKKVGQNSKCYQLIFWNKIFSPVTGVLMIITALLYSWGPFYQKKISIKLFFSSIIGFLFYILHQIFGILSITYNISPFIGSIGPIILLVIMNMIIFWRYV